MGFLNTMKRHPGLVGLMASWLGVCPVVQALETDQFYAWGKPIDDSTDILNAWVQIQVQDTLDSQAGDSLPSCEAAVQQVQKVLQHSIYQPIEMWIVSTSLVDRFPRSLEDVRNYRKHYVLSKTFPLDFARWLHPSPTVQIGEIRLGTDKLAHFFSEGWWYYKRWNKNREKLTVDNWEQGLLEYGVRLEKWVQGMTLTGIFSRADMEANYQGFLFYYRLCHGEKPMLNQQAGRWIFSDSFNFRDYVSPNWDESWNSNIYGAVRWKGIRSTLSSYCPMLHSAWVELQRERYLELDTPTPVEELVKALVAAEKLPDPGTFDITAVCAGQPEPAP